MLRQVLHARDSSGNDVPAVMAILVGALGERIGAAFAALAAMAMWFCGLSAVTWSSRTIYAFARDGGMPASGLWKRVSAKYLTPAPASSLSTWPGGPAARRQPRRVVPGISADGDRP